MFVLKLSIVCEDEINYSYNGMGFFLFWSCFPPFFVRSERVMCKLRAEERQWQPEKGLFPCSQLPECHSNMLLLKLN